MVTGIQQTKQFAPRITENDPRARQVRAELRRTADQVVGQVFYGTLLRQMRSSSLKGPYGHGGRGEEVFQSQLDAVLATEAGAARSTGLSEAMVRRFEDRAVKADADRQAQRMALEGLQRQLEIAQAAQPEDRSW